MYNIFLAHTDLCCLNIPRSWASITYMQWLISKKYDILTPRVVLLQTLFARETVDGLPIFLDINIDNIGQVG